VTVNPNEINKLVDVSDEEMLILIADSFDKAKREALSSSNPEGSLVITVSDELARDLAQRLRSISKNISELSNIGKDATITAGIIDAKSLNKDA